jgi:hypothetical protein
VARFCRGPHPQPTTATARNTTASGTTAKNAWTTAAESESSKESGTLALTDVPMSAALSSWLLSTGRTLTGAGSTIAIPSAADSGVTYSSVHSRILETFGLKKKAPSGVIGALMTRAEAADRARLPTSPRVAVRRSSVGEALSGLSSGPDAAPVSTTAMMARLAAVQSFSPGREAVKPVSFDSGGNDVIVNPLSRFTSLKAAPGITAIEGPEEWKPSRR